VNFRSLVTPVFAAVAASVTAFVLFVIFAASEQDDLSISSDRSILSQELDSKAQTLESFATDNAWWDSAVRKLLLSEDIEWLEGVLGTSVQDINFVDGTLALRADLSIVFSAEHQSSMLKSISPSLLLKVGLARELTKLDIRGDTNLHSSAGLLLADGKLIAYGASLVRPNHSAQFKEPLSNKRPIVVFYNILSDTDIKELGNKTLINNLRFSVVQPETAARLPVQGASDTALGWLVWDAKNPGTQMALDMVGPAVVLLILVFAAMVHFTRQAAGFVNGLEQANKSKSSFLASMSHEVRTPLNSILGFTELMSMELFGKIEGEKNKEYLQLIKSSGEHLLAIINDILDISKLEAGRFDVYAEKISPALIVHECSKMVETSALERDIVLTSKCEPVTIYSDERIMRQILLNILSNAVKFTQKNGAVHVTGEPRGDHYQIQVIDNGVGMNAAEIEVAFATFGQVQNEYTRSHGGTGLGLPLVKRFMMLLDGDMDITSKPGEGTTVTLIFPYRTRAKKL